MGAAVRRARGDLGLQFPVHQGDRTRTGRRSGCRSGAWASAQLALDGVVGGPPRAAPARSAAVASLRGRGAVVQRDPVDIDRLRRAARVLDRRRALERDDAVVGAAGLDAAFPERRRPRDRIAGLAVGFAGVAILLGAVAGVRRWPADRAPCVCGRGAVLRPRLPVHPPAPGRRPESGVVLSACQLTCAAAMLAVFLPLAPVPRPPRARRRREPAGARRARKRHRVRAELLRSSAPRARPRPRP